MYAHVRTYTHARRKFYDTKSALQHYQTKFHHQSDKQSLLLSNRCTIHINIGTTLAAPSVQTVIICQHLSSSVTHLPSTFQLSANHLSFISHLLISIHHLAHIIFHLYLMSNSTHHPINMSVCYKTLSILYILAALPYTTVFSSFISLSDSL